MQYIINHNEQGKILGFTKGSTDLNIEVSNAIWFEAQSFNKIIIDGDTISFDKFDWRTDEDIEKEELEAKINEAKIYLQSTDYKMTIDYFATMSSEQQEEVTRLRSEAREFVRNNE